MAHRDLGEYYRATGDFASALKHFTKSREFCSTSKHVLDMCLSVLEVRRDHPSSCRAQGDNQSCLQFVIEQRNYTHISSYIYKADGALESTAAATASSAEGGATAPSAQPTSKKPSPEREQVQSKLDFAMALSHLGQGNYEKAASLFLRLGPPEQLGDWVGKVGTSPGGLRND